MGDFVPAAKADAGADGGRHHGFWCPTIEQIERMWHQGGMAEPRPPENERDTQTVCAAYKATQRGEFDMKCTAETRQRACRLCRAADKATRACPPRRGAAQAFIAAAASSACALTARQKGAGAQRAEMAGNAADCGSTPSRYDPAGIIPREKYCGVSDSFVGQTRAQRAALPCRCFRRCPRGRGAHRKGISAKESTDRIQKIFENQGIAANTVNASPRSWQREHLAG